MGFGKLAGGSQLVEHNLKTLREAGLNPAEHGKDVYKIATKWGSVVYYPYRGVWLHHGRRFNGGGAALVEWFKRNHLIT